MDGFIVFLPIKSAQAKSTSQPAHLQLWHELEILRFLPNGADPAPYINQGRIYFLDAWGANWRSAGLLYYYSFLNLAKAFLIRSGAFTAAQVQTTRVNHGLSCSAQQLSSIVDLEVKVKPGSNAQNIFATLYEKLIGVPWPFTHSIPITVKQLLPYCTDISDEVSRLYNIGHVCESVLSLTRHNNQDAWMETICTDYRAQRMVQEITGYQLTTMPAAQLGNHDKQVWLTALRMTAATLSNMKVVRSPMYNGQQAGGQSVQAHTNCQIDARTHFKGFAHPTSVFDEDSPAWLWSPKISVNGHQLFWHPLLSNYLFSFALGSVLRYQPYLLVDSQPDYFLAEAWIRQSPITTLRDFLLFYDNVGIWIVQNR